MNSSILLKIMAIISGLKDLYLLVKQVAELWAEAKKAPNPEAAKAVVKHIVMHEAQNARDMSDRLKKVKLKLKKLGAKKRKK